MESQERPKKVCVWLLELSVESTFSQSLASSQMLFIYTRGRQRFRLLGHI